MMFHPMHLHGHTFAIQHPTGSGPRKDTVIVAPMQRLAVDLDADNPGHWVVHCHNLYHMEAGMMTSLATWPDRPDSGALTQAGRSPRQLALAASARGAAVWGGRFGAHPTAHGGSDR